MDWEEILLNGFEVGGTREQYEQLEYTEPVTVDNGPEFHGYKEIERATGVVVYFANPYCSWERGTNENTNGLLRQFHPKGTDFTTVRPLEIQTTQDFLNHRPRSSGDTLARRRRKSSRWGRG